MAHKDLEFHEDIRFQQRVWKVQRAGWIVLALTAFAALLGVFGHGPLSTAIVAHDPRLIWMEYERLDRFDTPSLLRIHIGAGAGHEGRVRLEFDQRYLSNIHIEHITPEPIVSEATSEGAAFVFRTADPNQPAVVTFLIKIQQIGFVSGRIRLHDAAPLIFRHFVYP